MPAKNEDLHGNVPDKCSVALLIIDMINDFNFPGGEQLFAASLPVAKNIKKLKTPAKQAGMPVIYVNDNFGKWRSDFQQQVKHSLSEDSHGKEIACLLLPDAEDYSVLKPKHSAFYSTPLDLLLAYLGAKTVILTGIAGDVCILFTANDAFMRDYHLFVPSDCIASLSADDNAHSLEQMQTNLDADTRPSSEIDFEELKRKGSERSKAE